MKVVDKNIQDLIPAEYNPRRLSDEAWRQLEASLKRFGAVDPAIVNVSAERKNIIVGGHQRIKVAKKLGWETFPCVEVDLSKEKERELNIRLNKNTGDWDWDDLGEFFEIEELTDWGFSDEELFGDLGAFENENESTEEPYTNKIDSPVYEAKGEKPNIVELYNNDKFQELVKSIESSSVPDDIKEFLKICACRHIVFDYENIADYYAHSDKEVQELMEESALVIIDFQDAINNGYVKLKDEVAALYGEEYNEE